MRRTADLVREALKLPTGSPVQRAHLESYVHQLTGSAAGEVGTGGWTTWSSWSTSSSAPATPSPSPSWSTPGSTPITPRAPS